MSHVSLPLPVRYDSLITRTHSRSNEKNEKSQKNWVSPVSNRIVLNPSLQVRRKVEDVDPPTDKKGTTCPTSEVSETEGGHDGVEREERSGSTSLPESQVRRLTTDSETSGRGEEGRWTDGLLNSVVSGGGRGSRHSVSTSLCLHT